MEDYYPHLLVASIVGVLGLIFLVSDCIQTEHEEELLKIPLYEKAAIKWVDNDQVKVRCHPGGRCDMIPPVGEPYKLYCNEQSCSLF